MALLDSSLEVVDVPEFREVLMGSGYDSVRLHDVLCNQEIDAFILLSSDQFVVEPVAPKPKRPMKSRR